MMSQILLKTFVHGMAKTPRESMPTNGTASVRTRSERLLQLCQSADGLARTLFLFMQTTEICNWKYHQLPGRLQGALVAAGTALLQSRHWFTLDSIWAFKRRKASARSLRVLRRRSTLGTVCDKTLLIFSILWNWQNFIGKYRHPSSVVLQSFMCRLKYCYKV